MSLKYQYKALTANGEVEAGAIDADSEAVVRRELKRQGLKVLEVELKRTVKKRRFQKIKSEELLQLFDELVTLVRSGISLADAIESLAEAQYNELLASSLESISSMLQQGQDFSTALAASDLNIPQYMLQLAEAGELTGKMAAALSEGVEQMRFDETLRSETKNALLYPSILVTTGVLAVGLVFAIVVPKFSNMLDRDIELPFLAEVVLRTGMFVNSNGLLLLLLIIMVAFALFRVLAIPSVKVNILNQLSTWPVVGQWLIESETGRWTAVLGALLSNGVPLMDSLQLANEGVKIPRRRAKLDAAAVAVKSGTMLSDALKTQDALLPTAYNILRVGERSGELPAMLKSLAELYEKSSRNRMKRMLILIEPLAILIIGGAIGTIILGIVLAITSASDIPL